MKRYIYEIVLLKSVLIAGFRNPEVGFKTVYLVVTYLNEKKKTKRNSIRNIFMHRGKNNLINTFMIIEIEQLGENFLITNCLSFTANI